MAAANRAPKSMAKKKTTAKKTAAKKAAPARKAAAKRPAKKAAARKAAPKGKKPAGPTYEQIAAAAFEVYQYREAHGIPGDSTSDWHEAEARLRS
jgi:hypothetical protein